MRPARSLAAAAALLLATLSAHASDVEAVPSVDLARYTGTWYEQAHLPLFFQRNCVANTTARYTLREDGHIDVLNQCDDEQGKRIEATAVARRVGDSTSKLEVRFAPAFLSFLPMVWGDYWIIDLDPDYRWAIVGTPDRKYLWFLTREKIFSQDQLEALIRKAQDMGYDTSRLVRAQ
jgi:apolipoprotein D and lipocalin family protein